MKITRTFLRVEVLHRADIDPATIPLGDLEDHPRVLRVRVKRRREHPRPELATPILTHTHKHYHEVPIGDDHEWVEHNHEHVHWNSSDGHHEERHRR